MLPLIFDPPSSIHRTLFFDYDLTLFVIVVLVKFDNFSFAILRAVVQLNSFEIISCSSPEITSVFQRLETHC